jgi:uncharacterized membrane protein YoaK (UPF0700 family)
VTSTASAVVGPSAGQTRRSLLGLAWLSLASGCTDVLSFLKLRDLFASAMTGNAALLAIAVARGQMLPASRSLTALVGFMLGASLATLMHVFGRGRRDAPHRLRALLLLETVLLGGCAALWSVSPNPIRGEILYLVIALFAVSMGVQGVAARHVDVSGISTVVFTSVLISMVMSITASLAGHANPSAPPASTKAHVGTFAAYLGGAALAAVLVSRYLGWLVWIPMAAVFLALCCWEFPYQRQRSAL